MFRKELLFRSIPAALVGLAGVAVFAACILSSPAAQAQRFEPRRQGGFFDQLFGGFQPQPHFEVEHPQPQVDSSRAPPPHKPETPPTTSIVVVGDSMADWLAYGLEEAFTDTPEVGIVRKHRTFSGLIRYEARSDLDWPHVARDILTQEKADYVVMMVGLADRTSIREAQPAHPAPKGKEPPKEQPKDASKEPGKEAGEAAQPPPEDAEQPSIVAPEPRRAPGGTAEFRSDRWAELYTKRIDDTIAALKSKGVPVLWVGLPAVRGTRSTADVVFLNDLYRARAEKAGIIYVDVWDGFVDEGGRYAQQGPDLEGQTRRLRAGDGVHFTKFGARKLAHYIEREIRRLMQSRATPVALPESGVTPSPDLHEGTAIRPVAGPVVPLGVVPAGSDELAGGSAPRQANNDPVATHVLIKGEPIIAAPGRADDFSWPRSGTAAVSPSAPLSAATPDQPAEPPSPEAARQKKQPPKQARTSQAAPRPQGSIPRQPSHDAPSAWQPSARSFDPFGWTR